MFSHLAANAGFAIILLYVLATLVVGWLSRRRVSGSNDFLNATHSQPFWIVAVAFFSTNCGALEIVGLSAVAAQYGVQAFHFYWIGAIPGMIFLSAVMMPIYMRSGVRSLPEYLERRYSPRLRLINAWLILLTVATLAGVGVYAMAQILHVVFGWPILAGILLAATVVLIYVLTGGLRATLYNEILQMLVIVCGLLPLALRIHPPSRASASPLDPHWHLWRGLPPFSPTSPLDSCGIIIGLMLVLSTNYWCTDFVLIQRALAARSVTAGRMVPLAAGFGKLGFSLLVILPALGAASYLGPHQPAAFDQTLPALMAASYGPLLLGLGLTALLASLMTGLAANVSAFASVWTEEIYRTSIHRNATEQHYLRMGRAAIVAAILLSIATSYLSFCFRDMMELVQMLFSLFGAPFLAVLLMGFFTRRATASGAITGLICGVLTSALFQLSVAFNVLHYGSQMSANFHCAAIAFFVALVIGLLYSRKKSLTEHAGLDEIIYTPRQVIALLPTAPAWWILALTLLACCILLNIYWQ